MIIKENYMKNLMKMAVGVALALGMMTTSSFAFFGLNDGWRLPGGGTGYMSGYEYVDGVRVGPAPGYEGLTPAEVDAKVSADAKARAEAIAAAFTGESAGYLYVNGKRVGKAPRFASLTPAEIYDAVAAEGQARQCAKAASVGNVFAWCR